MNPEFPIVVVVLLILSGFMQQRISGYFDGGEYTHERLVAKYSGWVCFAFALLFLVMNFFI